MEKYIISLYLYNLECLFVCLFVVNAKTTARIDAKYSGITKNNPETVLHSLKLPILVLLGRYRDISSFFLAANHHFYLSPFYFRLLPRRLTQSAFRKMTSTTRHIATDYLSLGEPSHLERKCYCKFFTMYCVPKMLFILRHYIKDLLQACNR